MAPYVIAIVGPSGSGKTRLIERLVPLLKRRGLKVGTVKHAHDRIDLDRPGKDSWRHVKGGAEVAAVVGPKQLMVIKTIQAVEDLPEALKRLSNNLDLILLEGFHEAAFPQIVVASGKRRIPYGRHVMAIVSDQPLRRAVPQFWPHQTRELAAFIDKEWTRQWEISYRPKSQASSSAGA